MINSRAHKPQIEGTPRRLAVVETGQPFGVKATGPAKSARNSSPLLTDTTEPALAGSTTTATSSTSSGSEGYWQGSNTANPNRQIGRLFFQQWNQSSGKWEPYNCSGTVVNSTKKSVAWTAGHCLYQTYSNVQNRYYVFCPGYRNGNCPLGKWTPTHQNTPTQWRDAACTPSLARNQAEFQYDLGILKMGTLNGWRIADWVGAHGIKFNGATYQFRYLFGYPLNKSAGEFLYLCSGNNTFNGYNMRIAPCTAGGGASGGPWLSELSSSWMGTVHSVNSHGDGSYMGGPYQGSVAQSLYVSLSN